MPQDHGMAASMDLIPLAAHDRELEDGAHGAIDRAPATIWTERTTERMTTPRSYRRGEAQKEM